MIIMIYYVNIYDCYFDCGLWLLCVLLAFLANSLYAWILHCLDFARAYFRRFLLAVF